MEPQNDSTPTSTENVEQNSDSESKSLTLDDVRNLLSETLEPLNNDLASLKRSTKKVVKESKGDTAKQTQSDDSDYSDRYDSLLLRTEGIKNEKEIALANKLKAETGMDMEKLLNSKYFQLELEELRTELANANASSDVKGDGSGGNAKQTSAYWIAKGEYPSKEQVPDRTVRAEIRSALMNKEKEGGKFYNG